MYDLNTKNLNALAGLYIFAYKVGIYWQALYIGQTNDFSSRLVSHERYEEAVRKGATHIHAMVVPLAAKRDTLEQLLIAHLQPKMNEHHRDLKRFAY